MLKGNFEHIQLMNLEFFFFGALTIYQPAGDE